MVNTIKNKIKLKFDPVLCVAIILAIISAFFVYPSKAYIKYIDFRTLGILWSLMIIIKGLEEGNLFEKIALFLLNKADRLWQLVAVLVFTCFISSMFITNDVALITFVPFSIMALRKCKKDGLILIVVVLETIAANMGSMLTPIGNPQNLYIYGISNIGIVDFILLMLPYSLCTVVLLIISIFFIPKKMEIVDLRDNENKHIVIKNKTHLLLYCFLFILALLTVLRFIPCRVLVAVVLLVVYFSDYKLLFKVDYALLFTFIAFFIFSGNLGKLPQLHDRLKELIHGREFITSFALSQVISNAPTTLLMSGFTHRYKSVILGADLGGLGTLIASMASVISYKIYAKEKDSKKIKYILTFNLISIIYLSVFFSYAFLVEHRKVERNVVNKTHVEQSTSSETVTQKEEKQYNDAHRIMTVFMPGLEKHSLEGALSSLDDFGFYNVKVKDAVGNKIEVDFKKLRENDYKFTDDYEGAENLVGKNLFVLSQSIPENVVAGTDFEIVLTVAEQ